MFLIMPFGVMSGFLTVAMAYLLSQAGMSLEKIAGLIAISFIPHTWKFLWAPIADTTLSRKRWYMLTAAISGFGIFLTSALPVNGSSYLLLSTVILLSNFAVTFLGMSVESLMAYNASDEEKGKASGWFQAGNLGGGGLGGGAGLWLAQTLPAHWMSGAILGLLCMLCTAGLIFVPEPKEVFHEGRFVRNLLGTLKDLWNVVRSRAGYLALLLCFLPLGTGAASGLWSAVAGDWHASAGTVELVTGVFGGIISAAGCIAGGYICDRMDRKTAYAMYGFLMALCAIAMALAPRTETMFIGFSLFYSFITGLSYAGFSSFVLEAMGLGAVATKYNLFAALSNMPIAYMTMADGWGHSRWGSSGMLFTEAAAAIAALLLFSAVVFAVRRPSNVDRLTSSV